MKSSFNSISSYLLNKDTKMNSRRCDICNIDVQRASCAEHLRSEKHLEKENEKNDYTRMVVSRTYWK